MCVPLRKKSKSQLRLHVSVSSPGDRSISWAQMLSRLLFFPTDLCPDWRCWRRTWTGGFLGNSSGGFLRELNWSFLDLYWEVFRELNWSFIKDLKWRFLRELFWEIFLETSTGVLSRGGSWRIKGCHRPYCPNLFLHTEEELVRFLDFFSHF